MLNYLRIAVTALCLSACVPLVALWVRSYSRADSFSCRLLGSPRVGMVSVYGCFSLGYEHIAPHGSLPRAEVEIDSILLQSNPFIARQLQAALPASGFNVASFPGGRRLDVPSYLVVLAAFVVTAFAASPCVTWRFSLRTLLIATTLVAVLLGLVIYLSG